MKLKLALPLQKIWYQYNQLNLNESIVLKGIECNLKDGLNISITKDNLTVTAETDTNCTLCKILEINLLVSEVLLKSGLENDTQKGGQEVNNSCHVCSNENESLIDSASVKSQTTVQNDVSDLLCSENEDTSESIKTDSEGPLNKKKSAKQPLEKRRNISSNRKTKTYQIGVTKKKKTKLKTVKVKKSKSSKVKKAIPVKKEKEDENVKENEGLKFESLDVVETVEPEVNKTNCFTKPRFGSLFGTVVCKICETKFMDERGREGHVRMYHKLTIDQYHALSEEETNKAAQKVRETLLQKLEKRKEKFLEKKKMGNTVKKPKAEQKKYDCEMCDTCLPYKTIIVHIKNTHHDEPDRAQARLCVIDSENSNSSTIRNTAFSFYCPFCKNQFYGSCVLRHMKKFHMNADNFEENYKRIYEEDRRNRMKLSTMYPRKQGTFKCDWCEKEFPKIGALNRHMKLLCKKAPNKSVIHKCNRCSYYSGNPAFLADHMKKRHSSDQRYICEICAAEYVKQERYTLHMRRKHNKVFKAPPKSCPHCQKEFAFNLQLQEHIARFHSETRNFLCNECPKKFKVREDLSKHIRIVHRKAYRYRCEKCNHGVDRKQYLTSHKCGRVRRKDAEEVWDEKATTKKVTAVATEHIKATPATIENDILIKQQQDESANINRQIEELSKLQEQQQQMQLQLQQLGQHRLEQQQITHNAGQLNVTATQQETQPPLLQQQQQLLHHQPILQQLQQQMHHQQLLQHHQQLQPQSRQSQQQVTVTMPANAITEINDTTVTEPINLASASVYHYIYSGQ